MRRPSRILSAALLALLSAGCQDYGGRQEVSGTIDLGDEPLHDAVIEFHPLPEQTTGVATRAEALVLRGKYRIPKAQGLTPGKYRVLITAGDGSTPLKEGELPGPGGNFVSRDRVPPEYNTASTQEVEVLDTRPNVFDYDIPARK